MAGNVPPNANQPNVNHPNPPPAQRGRNPFNLTPPLHSLPQNVDKSFPKFDLGEKNYVDDHLWNFFLDLDILAVEHEYVVCRMFPHTFKAKASAQYFGLPTNSITDWDTSERLFKGNFGSQRTTSALMKKLISLRMDKKE